MGVRRQHPSHKAFQVSASISPVISTPSGTSMVAVRSPRPAERRQELLDKRNGDAGHIDTRAIRCRALRALMPADWWLGPPTAGADGTGARGARPGLVQPPTAQEEDACERS